MKKIIVTFANKDANIATLFKDHHAQILVQDDVEMLQSSDSLVIHADSFYDENASTVQVKIDSACNTGPNILGTIANTFANAGFPVEFSSMEISGQQQGFNSNISILINKYRFVDAENGRLTEWAYKLNICINKLYNKLFNL